MSTAHLDRGRYEVRGVLGRSHYSTVYEAHDRKSGELVAVKVLDLASTHREIAEAMFRKEFGALDGFEHPAVVRMLGCFKEDDRVGLVLELVGGGETLEDRIRREPNRRPPLVWRVAQLAALLDGLDAAHQRRVTHRDIKPSNVLVDRTANALKLADFGIARLLESYGRTQEGVTLREFYTRPFAAPEQVLQGEATAASDLHAFGLLAASLLAWRLPDREFRSQDLPALLQPLRDEIDDSELLSRVDDQLSRLVASEPTGRPKAPSVAAVLAAVAERVGVRTTIPVGVTFRVVEQAEAFGIVGQTAVLADLNESLRARYEPTPEDEQAFRVECYGRRLAVRFVPDRFDPARLVAISAVCLEPSLHARRRSEAEGVRFVLEQRPGSADALVQALFGSYERARLAEESRKERRNLFSLGSAILRRQRDRLTHLFIQYEVVDRPSRAPTEFGRQLQQAYGEATDDLADVSGRTLTLKVTRVTGAQEDETQAEDEEVDAAWLEELDRKSPFLYLGKRIGTYYSYDHEDRHLVVRLDGKPKLPRQGTLECKNIPLEAALNRQETALEHFARGNCVNDRLGLVLTKPETNCLTDRPALSLFQNLKPAEGMLDVLERIVSANDMFLLQGPPGTGKTTIIAEAIAQILVANPQARVLLTSQANEAVDNALDSLQDLARQQGANWRLLRDVREEHRGKGARLGFEGHFSTWAQETVERSRQALAAASAVVPPERAEALRAALGAWQERMERTSDVREDYARTVQVFGATCLRVPALWKLLPEGEVRFDWVVVDEAAKATPAEVLVALIVGRRFLLVGDHRQLPPFLDRQTEDDLREAGVDPARARVSLFEELFERMPSSNRETLRRQYRMHRSIGDFVGQLFYADIGGLETGVADAERELDLAEFGGAQRVFWIDVPGQELQEGWSWWNRQELDGVAGLLRQWEKELGKGCGALTVGVIAAYAAQAARLRLEVVPRSKSRWQGLVAATVDAFQGRQVDVVIYSLVRSGRGGKQFLSDPRRLNVAFSRARRLLVILGSRNGALHSPELARVLEKIPADCILPAARAFGGGKR